jgi:hypothetical protein
MKILHFLHTTDRTFLLLSKIYVGYFHSQKTYETKALSQKNRIFRINIMLHFEMQV